MNRKVLLVLLASMSANTYAQSQGIDFMAIQRGRQQAAEDNYRNQQNMQDAQYRQQMLNQQYAHMMQERMKLQNEADADQYLSTVGSVRLKALADGYTEEGFWQAAWASMTRDPNFVSRSPEVQTLIATKFAQLRSIYLGR